MTRRSAFNLCFQFQLAPLHIEYARAMNKIVFDDMLVAPVSADSGLAPGDEIAGRGLHLFTSELNLSNSRTHS
jgi:hypothetical protein